MSNWLKRPRIDTILLFAPTTHTYDVLEGRLKQVIPVFILHIKVLLRFLTANKGLVLDVDPPRRTQFPETHAAFAPFACHGCSISLSRVSDTHEDKKGWKI